MPAGDADPEVLVINIIEIESDAGEYANQYLPFPSNLSDYMGTKVLAVPRCCQKRKGTQDRKRVNLGVRDRSLHERDGVLTMNFSSDPQGHLN